MIRDTCLKCQKELTVVQNAIWVIHFIDNDREKGIDEMRQGDLVKCMGCDVQIIINFGDNVTGYGYFKGNLAAMDKFMLDNPIIAEVVR